MGFSFKQPIISDSLLDEDINDENVVDENNNNEVIVNDETVVDVGDNIELNEDVDKLVSKFKTDNNDLEEDVSYQNTNNSNVTTDISFSEELDEHAPLVANHLFELGIFQHIPNDIDVNSFGLEELKKTLLLNVDETKKNSFQEGVNHTHEQYLAKLTPTMQKVLEYNLGNPNASDSEILSVINQSSLSQYITNLSPELNAEEIVQEYYKWNNWEPDEIRQEIDISRSNGSLMRKAELLKPKLDKLAYQLNQRKEQENNALKEFEREQHQSLKDRVSEQISKKEVAGITLDRETAQFLIGATMNEEIPVKIGNRNVHMGYAEALMRREKYEGNMENVMLSLIILRDGPEALKKYFKSEADKKAVVEQIKGVRFTNSKRKGANNSISSNTNSNTGFRYKIKK